MYSLINTSTTNLKLQTERSSRMNYELETANCTPQYLSKMKESCLCEARTHDFHITARRSTDETILNSFYVVFIVLIIFHSRKVYSWSNHIAPTIVREAQTHNLHVTARCSTTSKKKKKEKLSLWGSNSPPSHYSTTLYHTVTAPRTMEGQKHHKLLTAHKGTSWEHVGLAQAHPNDTLEKVDHVGRSRVED